ncbi:hypothetical protein STSO111631_05550 [Stackebrandtia soli]
MTLIRPQCRAVASVTGVRVIGVVPGAPDAFSQETDMCTVGRR